VQVEPQLNECNPIDIPSLEMLGDLIKSHYDIGEFLKIYYYNCVVLDMLENDINQYNKDGCKSQFVDGEFYGWREQFVKENLLQDYKRNKIVLDLRDICATYKELLIDHIWALFESEDNLIPRIMINIAILIRLKCRAVSVYNREKSVKSYTKSCKYENKIVYRPILAEIPNL
jgi:hypothetical protein